MSESALIAVALLLLAVVSTPNVICALKGKWILALLLGGIPALIGAIRLAKPDSWWARHYYDRDKLTRAQTRYAEEHATVMADNDELLAAWDGIEINEAELDPITRRALRKAGRIP